MKITATILIMYFSLLAAQPLTPLFQKAFSGAGQEQCSMPCCQKHHKKEVPKAPANNCCDPNMMCNPFGQYACCIGYLVERENTIPYAHASVVRDIVSTHNILVPNYSATCWHPPENTVC